METDFTYNDDGTFKVELFVEFAVIGHWINTELGSDTVKITALIEELKACKKLHQHTQKWVGHEYTLILENKEVQVMSNLIFSTLSEEENLRLTEENLSLYDEESFSEAGVEDLIDVLEEYHEFILSCNHV